MKRAFTYVPALALVALCGTSTAAAAAVETNIYEAQYTSTPPTLDGVAEAVWDKAAWDDMNYTYIGTPPTAADYSGRYKVLWDTNRIYLLVEVTDDIISDVHPDPLVNWWDDDCVEVFLDENHNGGPHQYNFSAWAYHISTTFDVVDYGTDKKPHLFNDHFQVKTKRTGTTTIWEMSMAVYGENYTLAGPNTALKLSTGKELGFTLAYCDNDGAATRDNFMGSVNTPEHMNNEGYLNADGFGTLRLVGTPPVALGPRQKLAPSKFAMSRSYSGRQLPEPKSFQLRQGDLVL